MAFTRNTGRSTRATIEKLTYLLDRIDPDISYPDWCRALMVVFNETGDSIEGFELADDWSSLGHKYRGTEDVRRTWQYFDLNRQYPVRMGTLVRMASR